MRRRSNWIVLVVAVIVLVATMGCSLAQIFGQKPPAPSPTNTKTPKPTFTATPNFTPTPVPTNTPKPTNTLVPTSTPAVTDTPVVPPTNTPEPKPQAIVNRDDLNFRAGPGTNYASLGNLAKGFQMEARMRTADSQWVRVCCWNNQEGWVNAQYVDLSVTLDAVPVDNSVPPTNTPAPPKPTKAPAAPTNTPVPAAPTATPAPAYYYRSVVQTCFPNAGATYIKGTVWEGTTPQNGKRVRMSWQADGPAAVDDYVTGSQIGEAVGVYSVILDPQKPREGDWYVWVVDDTGKRISEVGHVRTTLNAEGAGACQQIYIDFAH